MRILTKNSINQIINASQQARASGKLDKSNHLILILKLLVHAVTFIEQLLHMFGVPVAPLRF